MEEGQKPLLLLELVFGDSVPCDSVEKAGIARRGVAGRLLAWAEAFEDWIGEKQTRSAVKQARYAWQKLLRNRNIMLWELGEEDIQAHVTWMGEQGYAASTMINELGSISNFYRWCDERRIDPLCEAGFNPAAGVKRPTVRRFATARLWSQGEVERLLGFARRDESPLGKRDYAFLLTRLQVGVPTRVMRDLQWGQLRQGDELRVRWSSRDETGTGCSGICGINPPGVNPGQAPASSAGQVVSSTGQASGRGWSRFPDEAWAAISDFLEVSGRLAGMQTEDYIFAPLALPGSKRDKTRASDWAAGRCITAKTAKKNIRIYGCALGIPKARLNLEALRNTAIRLQLDAGKNIDEMQVFLDSQVEAKQTKFKMKHLPPMPPDRDPGGGEIVEVPLPNRKAVHFQAGDGLLHGYYLKSQPAECVLAVIAEGIKGEEEELQGLRLLARGLVERLITAQSSSEVAQLADAQTRAAAKLAALIEFDRQLEQEGEGEHWLDEAVARIDQFLVEEGWRTPREKCEAQCSPRHRSRLLPG